MAIIRVEKTKNYTVMSNRHLKDARLSLKAKGLLSLALALPDNWNYSIKGLASICREGVDCIGATINELVQAGYITRRRTRDARGRITDLEYTIHESPVPPDSPQPGTDHPQPENPAMDQPSADEPKLENRPQLNTNQAITHGKKKEKPTTDPSILQRIADVRDAAKEQIEYDFLLSQFSRELLDEIVELMTEVQISTASHIRIERQDIPTPYVQERFRQLSSFHVQFALVELSKGLSKMQHPKHYVLTTLYNTYTSMNLQTQNEVAFDMRNKGYFNR